MRLIGSARLTALLFVVFLVLFLIGILVPQDPIATTEQVENFARKWPTPAAVARVLWLDDVYRSPWMYAVFALFVVQMLIYLTRRSALLWSDPWLSSDASPEQLPPHRELRAGDEALETLAATLQAARYRLRREPGRLVAVRNRRSPLWGLLFHASLVVLLLGGWIVRVSALHGVVQLTEEQAFAGAPQEYSSLEPPGADADYLPRLGFTVGSITPTFGGNGQTTDIAVALRLDDGSDVEVGVNRPATIDGADLLIKNFGLAPVFSVSEVRGQHRRHVESLSPRLICWSPGLPTDAFEFRRLSATVAARFWPEFVAGADGPTSASMNQRDPVLGLTLTRDDIGETLPEQRLRVGESLTVGDVELKLEELRTWGEFLVSRQAGTVLLLGFVLMVAGSAMRLFFPRRMVVAELRDRAGEPRLVIGGRGEYFPVGFQWELDAMAERLGKRPDGGAARTGGEDGQD